MSSIVITSLKAKRGGRRGEGGEGRRRGEQRVGAENGGVEEGRRWEEERGAESGGGEWGRRRGEERGGRREGGELRGLGGGEEGRSLCWPSTRIKEKLIEKSRECHITSRSKSLTLRGREKAQTLMCAK